MGKGTRREGVGVESKVQGSGRGGGTGKKRGEGETRTIECGGVLGSLVRSDERRFEERGEKKT